MAWVMLWMHVLCLEAFVSFNVERIVTWIILSWHFGTGGFFNSSLVGNSFWAGSKTLPNHLAYLWLSISLACWAILTMTEHCRAGIKCLDWQLNKSTKQWESPNPNITQPLIVLQIWQFRLNVLVPLQHAFCSIYEWKLERVCCVIWLSVWRSIDNHGPQPTWLQCSWRQCSCNTSCSCGCVLHDVNIHATRHYRYVVHDANCSCNAHVING